MIKLGTAKMANDRIDKLGYFILVNGNFFRVTWFTYIIVESLIKSISKKSKGN